MSLEVGLRALKEDFGAVATRVTSVEEKTVDVEGDIDSLSHNSDALRKYISNKIRIQKKEEEARAALVDKRLDALANLIDFVVTACGRAGVVFTSPPPPDTTVLPTAVPAPVQAPPPIMLTPSTPANTQEAKQYASRTLQAPSLTSFPPIPANTEDVADQSSAEVDGEHELVGDGPPDVEEQQVGAAPSDAGEEGAPMAIDAGPTHESESAEDADRIVVAKPDEADEADEAAQTPAQPTQATNIHPPPLSQTTLLPASTPLPPFLPPGSQTHSRGPPLSGPQPSTLPGQASRRSPRLQNPIVNSPKEKRPRPDDEGRGTSKRRKE